MLDDGRLELGDHAGQGQDVEHPWPPARRSTISPSEWASTDRLPTRTSCDGGQVATQVAPEALDGLAGLLELEAGIEQALDHLQLEDVAVGVAPLAPAAGGVGDRRTEQTGPGPVVQLAVGDAHQRADLGTPESLARDLGPALTVRCRARPCR